MCFALRHMIPGLQVSLTTIITFIVVLLMEQLRYNEREGLILIINNRVLLGMGFAKFQKYIHFQRQAKLRK